MNRKIFYLLYNAATRSEKLKKTAVALSKGAELFFFIIYGIGALMIFMSGKYLMLAKYLIIPFVTLCYNTFLRRILKRPRPFVKEENVVSLRGHKESYSCPSNHAASAAVIAMSWYCIMPQAVIILMIPAFFTGVSRMMTGEHYPFDVALGWLIGITAGLLGFVIRF